MKYTSLAILALLSTAQAASLQTHSSGDNIWSETLDAGIDASVYLKDSPKGYTEKEKPKPDPNIELRKKKKIEEEYKKKLDAEKRAEDRAKDIEEMNIQLYTFAKTLKPSAMHQALAIKERLEDQGKGPDHFRVSARNLWSHGFKHDAVANYQFVKERLQDLDVAEKNLNRNIDSKAQLEIFIKEATDVKNSFIKRYGAAEWEP